MTKLPFEIIKGKFYNLQTGEEITRKEAKEIVHNKALELTDEYNEALRSAGLRGDIKTRFSNRRSENNSRVTIKEDYDFNKLFRVELGELMQNQSLSKNARCVIGTLSSFVTFPTNAIKINNKYPSFEDLRKLIDMSPVTLKKAFKDLEYYEVIKREKSNGQYIIYFNPFLICVGMVDTDTYVLFKNSTYNPENQ